MKNKLLSFVLSVTLLSSLSPVYNVSALEETATYETEAYGEENRAAGLISSYAIGCTGGSKTVYLTAEVFGTEIMSKIGFKNIKIQRSSNQSSWTTEKTLSDMISEDVSLKKLSLYPVSVDGGYYYRIVLDNYAKENTWWFPETQTVQAISSSVWIS